MWLFLGFVSFFVATAVLLYRKLYVCWTPDEIKSGNTWRYKHYKNKNGIVQLCWGINGLRDYHFSFAPESGRHQFGKWCGLAREFQTGDANFDELVYILSDNEFLHGTIASSPKVRQAVTAIFNYGIPSMVVVKEIVCANKNLWVRFKTGSGYSPASLDDIARALLPHLNTIKEEINKVPYADTKFWKDPFFLKAMVLVSISSGLAINAFLHFWRVKFLDFPFLLSPISLFPLSVLVGLGICLLLVALLFLWVGRSARTHLVFFEMVTIGLFGAIATSFIELRDYNIEADVKMPEVKVAYVESVYSRTGRKSSTRYYMELRDWRCDCDRLNIQIPYYLYAQLKTGDSVDVFQHPGALGNSWVSDLRKHQD